MRTIWLFGPSGAGKTTIGKELQEQLKNRGRNAVLVDGDELRSTVCKDLGFSYNDRLQQSLRAAYMAKAINSGNSWAIVCLITPFKEFRDEIRKILDNIDMVYLESSKQERIKRDPKGLYAKAIAGELIFKLTGYDGDFDEPSENEAIIINTEQVSARQAANNLLELLIGQTFVGGSGI